MCFFKVKTPSVQAPTASALVPEVNSPEPESAMYGGSEDTFNKRKGRQQLTIKRNAVYNPTNY